MDTPLACNLAALDAAARTRRQALAAQLAAVTLEIRERPDGYAFRYPAGALLIATEFVALEQRCCLFFRFALEVGADGGPLWLAITSREGVKAFLLAELGTDRGLAGAR